ncbi:Transcriptional regulator, MarR family [Orrella dioscoreae]|uniref:Transcriptional regulator, MarR family n=2 Tax=root TaxID=1 RepID=A0A1C3K185_9BURK|nr:Transcriptional regulator, MarR family [Orrella dioscoreae]SOE47468.1 Transcriptional regulator, MarR family [Orrella dioscoreae]
MDMTMSLTRTARRYRNAADRQLAELGLSQATAWPIYLMGRLGDGVRQGALAEELGVEGPTLVRVLDHLEAAGYLQRREDANDRRAKTLHLTPAGEALRKQVETLLADFRRQVFAGIAEADLAVCLKVFARVTTSLRGGNSEGAR